MPAPSSFRVLTCNVRADFESPAGDPDHWPDRAPVLQALLRREGPDVLGVQEALWSQMETIAEALPGHRHIGFGREGGSAGEHSAIWYDAERFEVTCWDQLALSDAPRRIGSATWGHVCPRVVVGAVLRDRATGEKLAVLNTHLDHESEAARVRGARMIAALVEGDGPVAGLPVVLTGDFNCHARDAAAHRALVADGPFDDAWDAARERLSPEWGTFPEYGEPAEGTDRIDWILTRGLDVMSAEIVDPRGDDGRWHSDHMPVRAEVALRG